MFPLFCLVYNISLQECITVYVLIFSVCRQCALFFPTVMNGVGMMCLGKSEGCWSPATLSHLCKPDSERSGWAVGLLYKPGLQEWLSYVITIVSLDTERSCPFLLHQSQCKVLKKGENLIVKISLLYSIRKCLPHRPYPGVKIWNPRSPKCSHTTVVHCTQTLFHI